MLIIDSQIHLWEADRPERPWPSDGRLIGHRLDNPMHVGEALEAMDGAGVAKAVLVPPSFEGDRNDVVGTAVQDYPDRFVAFGRIPLTPSQSEDRLRREMERFGLTGFRLTFNREHYRDALRRGELEWFWRACSQLDIPLMMQGREVLDELEGVARSYPDLRLALDHLNLTGTYTRDELLAHASRVCALARLPNVNVKASALPCYLLCEPPFTELRDAMYLVLDAFGAERVFWGSDLSRLPCPYEDWVDFARSGLDALSVADRNLLLGGAIATWLRL